MRTVDILYLISVIVCTTTALTLSCLGFIYILYLTERVWRPFTQACANLWYWMSEDVLGWVMDKVFGCDGRKPRE